VFFRSGSQNRVPSNQPPVALRPAKVKAIDDDKSAKKVTQKKNEKDVNE
jgi:cell division protease FtsH